MKKLGFSKRSESGDDDGNRLALFGSRSKNKSPAPDSNPYAQPPPRTDPYSLEKAKVTGNPSPGGYGLPSGPKQNYGGQGNQNGSTKSQNPYGGSNGGYSASKQGDQGAYGGDRYGGGGGGNTSRYGPSGYGGLGRTDPNDPNAGDDNRAALFGGARERYEEREQGPSSRPPPSYSESDPANPNPNSAASGGGPTPYQDRQLTAEEEEEEDVQATKQEIRFVKQQDVASTRNALRLAAQAEESGRGTLARLGAQGERIYNAEKNLDLAANQNRMAEEKSRELKKVNKSMFAMHVANPFTSDERRRARDEAIIDRHQQERIQREDTRMAAFRTEQRMQETFKDMSRQGAAAPAQHKSSLAERSKYQFEADSEDDEMENEIESNLTALHGAAGRLNALARATGREIEEQNSHLDRIAGKSDYVDDQINLNRARLDRIR
ncbi:hypothetical protein AJ80_08937 [Polytolypa hystricis UAMH7299]|uniref:t-SNARE coiled-coil homology domain-containing protein n=1 Tax=Polytolypa hystricis (strain UAMH7299) TaxID=1447883 RepID=A0A2B7WZ48_POLH7|nr:hypothetical protein AJ80_08937 [Polytolypa hystricis UAMH7299]